MGGNPAQAEPLPEVTILIYHRFGESRYPSTNVAVERFREQMAYLLSQQYTVMPLADLVARLAEKRPLPAKGVVITIDDGYRSTYEQAWPILQDFGFPFTVFLSTANIEKGYGGYLSWPQISEMREAGVDFQDHGFAHGHLATLPEGMDDAAYRRGISGDLIRSARVFIERLGDRPRFLAIPYGEYNVEVIEEAVKLGYEAIFTQDPGSVGPETPLTMIPREPILGNDWATMAHFEMVLQRVDLGLTELNPQPVRMSSSPKKFGARIITPDRFKADRCDLYVSELGWLPSTYKDGVVSASTDKPLTRRLNRVMIRAWEKETGRSAVRSWLLVGNQPAPD
ncbi:MAG: polysaccharide deacetylase family protein [Proteobacteria bacterium]|nr:polysaccharide deacetylase family protein [Pseudomonadota bacterium]MBU1688039.1 polysaccharide deacetylase family protein [Pseudomonadota bacterium]